MKRTGDEMDASRSQNIPPNEPHGGRRTNIYDDAARLFLTEVQDTFQDDQSDKYVMFLMIMADLKEGKIVNSTAVARAKELFKGHNNLIIGFNTFLPPGYKITLDDEEEDTVTENKITFDDEKEDSVISTARDH